MALIVVQGGNFLIPFVTLPYLVRVLNPDGFGTLVFAQSLVQYVVIATQYGFDLSATKKISLNRTDHIVISKTFWSVIVARLVLAVACFLLLNLVLMGLLIPEELVLLVLCSGITLGGTILFPTWYFQGIERMSISAVANLVPRLLAIPFVFIFVDRPGDGWISALITGIGNLMAGVFGFYLALRDKWICRCQFGASDVVSELKDGWHIFLSTAAVSLYSTTTTVVLGIISGPVSVGFFVAGLKLKQAGQAVLSPVSNALFPRVSLAVQKDVSEGLRLVRKLLVFQSILTFFVSVGMYAAAPFLVNLIFGAEYSEAISVVKWLSWLPFIVGLSNVLGVQTLLSLGYTREFSRVLIIAGIANLILLIPLAYLFDHEGAAMAVFTTESLVTVLMFFVIRAKGVDLMGTSSTRASGAAGS